MEFTFYSYTCLFIWIPFHVDFLCMVSPFDLVGLLLYLFGYTDSLYLPAVPRLSLPHHGRWTFRRFCHTLLHAPRRSSPSPPVPFWSGTSPSHYTTRMRGLYLHRYVPHSLDSCWVPPYSRTTLHYDSIHTLPHTAAPLPRSYTEFWRYAFTFLPAFGLYYHFSRRFWILLPYTYIVCYYPYHRMSVAHITVPTATAGEVVAAYTTACGLTTSHYLAALPLRVHYYHHTFTFVVDDLTLGIQLILLLIVVVVSHWFIPHSLFYYHTISECLWSPFGTFPTFLDLLFCDLFLATVTIWIYHHHTPHLLYIFSHLGHTPFCYIPTTCSFGRWFWLLFHIFTGYTFLHVVVRTYSWFIRTCVPTFFLSGSSVDLRSHITHYHCHHICLHTVLFCSDGFHISTFSPPLHGSTTWFLDFTPLLFYILVTHHDFLPRSFWTFVLDLVVHLHILDEYLVTLILHTTISDFTFLFRWLFPSGCYFLWLLSLHSWFFIYLLHCISLFCVPTTVTTFCWIRCWF